MPSTLVVFDVVAVIFLVFAIWLTLRARRKRRDALHERLWQRVNARRAEGRSWGEIADGIVPHHFGKDAAVARHVYDEVRQAELAEELLAHGRPDEPDREG